MRGRSSKNEETILKFVNYLPIQEELNGDEEIIQKCPQCNYEIKFFNDDFLLSWQMHIQESYHIIGKEELNTKRFDQYKPLLDSKNTNKHERQERGNKRERHRQRGQKGKNNAKAERRNDEEEKDDNSDTEDNKTSDEEKDNKLKSQDRKKNKNNENKRKNEEQNWKTYRSKRNKTVAKNGQSFNKNKNITKEDEACKYINLRIPSLRDREALNNIYAMFPNVSMINNWGYEQEMLSQKQMLMTKKLEIIEIAIKNAFKLVYKEEFSIKLFGSRITGLATEDTNDVDIFIDTGDALQSNERKQIKLLKELSIKMQKSESIKNEWSNVISILDSRTPIVKAKYNNLRLSCDISIKNRLAVINTGLLKVLFSRLPIMRQIILILRIWMKDYFSNVFTNYSLAMMVLFYFQNEKELPSVLEIGNMNSEDLKFESGWIVCDYEKIKQLHQPKENHEMMSLVEHLYKFFKFYTNFNFERDVVCPFLGYTVKKSDFVNNGENLPPELYNYVALARSNLCDEFIYDSPMCIQDPVELNHNLSKAVKTQKVFQFQVMCELSQFALGDLCSR